MERILTAAATVFARSGFAGTTIQGIADEAHVGKATVYTYWADQRALFSTLAHDASVAIERLLSEGVRSDLFGSGESARSWLNQWLHLIGAYGAVLHIWTHEVMDDSTLGPAAELMYTVVSADLDSLIADTPLGRPYGESDHVHPGTILLWVLLVEFPYTLLVQLPELDQGEVRELILAFVRRGLLGDQ